MNSNISYNPNATNHIATSNNDLANTISYSPDLTNKVYNLVGKMPLNYK